MTDATYAVKSSVSTQWGDFKAGDTVTINTNVGDQLRPFLVREHVKPDVKRDTVHRAPTRNG